jgi:hypothetical protein
MLSILFILLPLWAATSDSTASGPPSISLLPDGLMASGRGISGNIEVGATQESGHSTPLEYMGMHGAFAYRPEWQGEAVYEVQSTQPADSMVLTRSRLGVILSTFNREPGKALGLLSAETEWWNESFHLDTGTKAIDVNQAGIETHLGLGLGGIGGRSFQGAFGATVGMRLALMGPELDRPELLVRTKTTLYWNLQDLLVHTSSYCQGLGIYLTFPVQWDPYPIDPAAGTGRSYALPHWEYGVRFGLTALL